MFSINSPLQIRHKVWNLLPHDCLLYPNNSPIYWICRKKFLLVFASYFIVFASMHQWSIPVRMSMSADTGMWGVGVFLWSSLYRTLMKVWQKCGSSSICHVHSAVFTCSYVNCFEIRQLFLAAIHLFGMCLVRTMHILGMTVSIIVRKYVNSCCILWQSLFLDTTVLSLRRGLLIVVNCNAQ